MHKPPDREAGLKTANIRWQYNGTPVSNTFQDVYFSRDNGLEESRYVFLKHSKLALRWRQMPEDKPRFIIIETGFGTGLNLLATWQLWRQHRPGSACLHYVSIEKHPLRAVDIARSNRCFPELQALSSALCRQYPPTLPGIHSIGLEDGLQLTLCFGDIEEMLDAIGDCDHPRLRTATSIKADAWFLDGFAPAKNPAMWSAPVFSSIATLSKPGTSFATFTAAGQVKRGMADAGFSVRKVKGFGCKREMLCGTVTCTAPTTPSEEVLTRTRIARARSSLAWHTGGSTPDTRRTALIIGAGLAGSHCAAALAESGWQVTVLERAADSASEASGNRSGVLYTRLSSANSDLSAFHLSAYLHASRHYRSKFLSGELTEGVDGSLNGMLQLGFDARERKHIKSVMQRYSAHTDLIAHTSASEASALCGIKLEHPALFFPASGWLSPRHLCRRLLAHPKIKLLTHCEVTALDYADNSWHLSSATGDTHRAPVCIIAAGLDSRRLAPVSFLPTRPVGGQVTRFRPRGPLPGLSICHEGYTAPQGGEYLSCGASFRLNDAGSDIRLDDHRQNLQQLAAHIPSLLDPEDISRMDLNQLGGRAAVRCTTPDRLPIVGPAPRLGPLLETFLPLSRDARADIPSSSPCWPGLYVNTGHGSRCLATTPIAGALLAALLNHTPRPLPWRLVRALSPARFPIRELIRGTRQ